MPQTADLNPSLDLSPLQQAEALADAGLFLQAQTWLPQLEQMGSAEKLQAMRIKGHLGGARQAQAGLLRLWRARKQEPVVMQAYLANLVYQRGPYRAWRGFQEYALPATATPRVCANWFSTQAKMYGELRDFERAEACYRRARELAPQDLWIQVEWSYVCECRDQYQAALEHAQEVVRQQPNYRSGVQALAHFLTLVGRDEEALALLGQAFAVSESAWLGKQLFDLQFELGLYAQASETLAIIPRYMPLEEKGKQAWLAAMRVDLALRLGDVVEAHAQLIHAKGPFYEKLASRLAQADASAKRVLLPVGFVRQNYMTCAPATLSALSRYWQREADHLEIADEICYDGTSQYSERKWAQDQEGYYVREFTVNWQVARELLDAGVPFTLVTQATASAHLQAVIGYDELRGTLLIRDPFQRTFAEFDAEKLFTSHASSGPRGMLFVPQEKAAEIVHINLPEAKVWDVYHAILHALQQHDRERAAFLTGKLREKLPQHRLSLMAQRTLAHYDGDSLAMLAVTEALLQLYPQDSSLQLAKASQLSNTRTEQVAWLEQVLQKTSNDPYALSYYAAMIMDDARQAKQAERILHRSLCIFPNSAQSWFELGNVQWLNNQKEVALECFRIASCLEETSEQSASMYFQKSLALGEFETALAHLFARHARLGHKSSAPFITLFLELETLERTEEAFELLKDALPAMPEDANLVLFAVDTFLRYGKVKAAQLLLERPGLQVKKAPWLAAQAKYAREIGAPQQALQLALQAAQLEPLNVIRQNLVVTLQTQLQGRITALAYMKKICQRFPHHYGLHETLVLLMREEAATEGEAVLRHLLSLNQNNPWAQRELAVNLTQQKRYDEAHQAANLALAMAPQHDAGYVIDAGVFWQEGDMLRYRARLREALRCSIDNDYALRGLIQHCNTHQERQEELAFIRGELMRQVSRGDALLCLQEAANHHLQPEELTEILLDARTQRPELWQAWVAYGCQLLDNGQLPLALEALQATTQKFPLCPRAFVELARAQALAMQRPAALQTLGSALRISPGWSYAVRIYVETVLDEGEAPERALKVLAAALARDGENAELHIMQANVLLAMKQYPECLASLEKAITIAPSFNQPWSTMRQVATQTNNPDLLVETARTAVKNNPGYHWCWIRLAESASDLQEAMQAAERALELEPESYAAFETKLEVLMRAGDFSGVLKALEAPPRADLVPSEIRIYAARVEKARGNHQTATAMMRQILQQDPNHYRIWMEYADYMQEQENYDEYLNAAENLLRLSPNHHLGYGYYADALTHLKREAEAQPYFARAFAIDPSYGFAGFALFDIAYQNKDVAEAERILQNLERLGDNPLLYARQVQFATLTQNRAAVRAPMEAILRFPDALEWSCKTAIVAMCDAGWQSDLIKLIAKLLKQDCGQEMATWFFLSYLNENKPSDFYGEVQQALKNDARHKTKCLLIDWLVEKKLPLVLMRFVNEYRNILRQDVLCWAKIGYAYLSFDQLQNLVDWMSDWRERDAPAWALGNYALALRYQQNHELAREVSLRCLELEPDGASAKVWLAFDAVRLNQTQQLAEILAELGDSVGDGFYQDLLQIAQHYLRASQQTDPLPALQQFQEMRQQSELSLVARTLLDEIKQRFLKKVPWYKRPWYAKRYA